jgi:hypothetical protein
MPADASAAWDSGNIARSQAERGRYGPEFETPTRRYPAPVRVIVGLSD